MNLEESVASVDGQLLNLLIVLRVGTVVVAVGPEPQLKQKLIEYNMKVTATATAKVDGKRNTT